MAVLENRRPADRNAAEVCRRGRHPARGTGRAAEATPERGAGTAIYSAWGRDDGAGCEFLLTPGRQLPPQEAEQSPGLQLLKVFEAASYNDAMRQYYEWQGWKPYKPMRDADGNEYPEDSTPHSE